MTSFWSLLRWKCVSCCLPTSFRATIFRLWGSALAALEGRDEAIGANAIMELMGEVDKYIPQPERPKDQPFLRPIEDVLDLGSRYGCDGSC